MRHVGMYDIRQLNRYLHEKYCDGFSLSTKKTEIKLSLVSRVNILAWPCNDRQKSPTTQFTERYESVACVTKYASIFFFYSFSFVVTVTAHVALSTSHRKWPNSDNKRLYFYSTH